MPRRLLLALIAALAFTGVAPNAGADSTVHTYYALTLLGQPKYPADFKHFDFVNPDAPKGGDIKLAAIGSFDSFNPYIVKGDPADGIGGLFETLMVGDPDEADASYGLLAQSVEIPEDRSWVAFNLRPEARFQDGKPVTAEDVVFSFDILKAKGDPHYALYYADVTKVEAVGPLKVKFTLRNVVNRELPVIIGQLPVLPKHYWQDKKFDETTLVPPLGSGPYKIDSFEAGRYIVYRRDPNYWGARLPVNVGRNNFDTLRFDYYKDLNVAHIAFLAGAYDFKREFTSKAWATQYDSPAIKDGRILRLTLPDHNPAVMQCFVFNTRKPFFQDVRVREAIDDGFDFEWTNKTLFYGLYKRNQSYYDNSELASTGVPSGDELKILEPFRSQLPPELFTRPYQSPTTDGSGNNRPNLRKAMALLHAAGWVIKDQRLVDGAAGAPFSFEILLEDQRMERVALPFVENLKRLGIDAHVRTVDPAQFIKRVQNFDYDMIIGQFPASLSPGNELRDYWSSEAADTPGSQNVVGVKDPVIDALINEVIAAPDRAQLVTRVHALDRVLLWRHFVVPQWHSGSFWLAFWNRFGRPERQPEYGLGFDTWWVDPVKDKALAASGRS